MISVGMNVTIKELFKGVLQPDGGNELSDGISFGRNFGEGFHKGDAKTKTSRSRRA